MVQQESNVGRLLQHGIAELSRAGIENPHSDATLLLGNCLSLSRTSLYLAANDAVRPESVNKYYSFLERRLEREPVAYIIGEREFWSLNFLVSPDVLIPRPETEFLLEMVFSKRREQDTDSKCLDLCCGSGVIAVVLAIELGGHVLAVDISFKALTIARENCRRHGVSKRVTLLQGDLFQPVRDREPFSLIVSNPPYVKHSDIMTTLEPDVVDHEPIIALDGGRTGLECIERIVESLPYVLALGGDFFMEIGDGQGELVQSMFLENGGDNRYEFVHVYTDYSGRDRVIHLRRNEQQD